jgi:hypothetical protein
MTAGRQPRVNEEINWVTDEDNNVLGFMKDASTFVPIPTIKNNPLTGGDFIVGSDGSTILAACVSIKVNDTSAAAANTTAIQTALNGGGVVKLEVPNGSIVYINASLVIDSSTTFDAGVAEIMPTANIGNLLRSKPDTLAGTAVTVTWSAGMTAAVAWTAHGRSVGDWVWLNRADQGQFNGVFQVAWVPDSNSVVVQLVRQPTVTATGSIVARPASSHIRVLNGIWNYNFGTNNQNNTGAHIIKISGVYDLDIQNIRGKNTMKYLVCLGGVANYRVNGVGGDVLNSATVKVYGPAFNGLVQNLWTGSGGDDIFSAQTKEPPAYSQFDFCQGDVLGLIVENVGGHTTKSAVILYPSSAGVIDGVVLRNVKATTTSSPLILLETLFATGSEIGTVCIENPVVTQVQRHLVSLGSGANVIKVGSLIVDNPTMRSASNQGHLVVINGTAVTANVTIRGGYVNGIESILNQAAGGNVNCFVDGLRVGTSWQTFRVDASGTMSLNLKNVVFESNPGTAFLNNNAGSPTIKLRAENVQMPSNPVITLTGTPTFSIYSWDLPVDVGATGFAKTINGQYAMNTSAGGARGTLTANRLVTCNGTNWVQVDTPANVF